MDAAVLVYSHEGTTFNKLLHPNLLLKKWSEGGTIKWLVKKMRVKLAEGNTEMNLYEEISNHVVDHLMAGLEEILGYTTGSHRLKEKLDRIDDKWFRPRLLRYATKTELDEITKYYEKLVMKEHYRNLQVSGAKLPRVKTEIRHLDSELALDKLGGQDEDEQQAQERHHKLLKRREEEDQEENKKHGDNFHKFFSSTLHTVRSRLHLKVGLHDKNMVHDNSHHLISHLRQKRERNRTILRMRSREEDPAAAVTEEHHFPKSLSFNLDGTRTVPDHKPSQVKFTVQDTVHEENETTNQIKENGTVAEEKVNVTFILDEA